jgi:copper chaperone CopZ
VQKVERTLRVVPGVTGVTVVPKDGEVFVTHEAGVSARDLVAALAAAGVTARVATP